MKNDTPMKSGKTLREHADRLLKELRNIQVSQRRSSSVQDGLQKLFKIDAEKIVGDETKRFKADKAFLDKVVLQGNSARIGPLKSEDDSEPGIGDIIHIN